LILSLGGLLPITDDGTIVGKIIVPAAAVIELEINFLLFILLLTLFSWVIKDIRNKSNIRIKKNNCLPCLQVYPGNYFSSLISTSGGYAK
jgi:hypothetical protein